MKQLFTLLFLILLQLTVSANTYYASPTGTGSGTLVSPCSFASGLTKLTTAGDTLYLRGGIYSLSAKVSINKSGTTSARICIMAYPGEQPILDFSTQPYSSSNPGISLAATSSYMHIKGLVVRYTGDNGIINNGSNTIIENCEFYGNCDTGLQHKSGGNNLIINCDSHDNFDYESMEGTVVNYGGNADGFADKQYSNVNPNTYIGCRAWNNSDDGWDFFQKIGSSVLKNCVCYRNGPTTYNMVNHPRYLTDKAWFDQFANLAAYPNYGNGNGFKLGGDYTAHNVTAIRCLAVGNRVRGFDQNNNYGTMTITNGSAYQNGINYGFGNNTGGSLIIKNCVSLSSVGSNAFNAKVVTNTNNSWNKPSVTVNSSDFVSLDTSMILAARNTDGSYSTPFMNLVNGSDLIDAGIYVGIEYAGNFPDLGYYEYGTIDKFPPIVTSQNTTQSILLGNPIVNITFTWGGGATGLDTANIPPGITATFNYTNKTLTLQGTPPAAGNFSYTVTSVGGADMPIVTNGNIYVSSASTKRIAYFTLLPLSAADSVVFNKLNANPDFLIIPVDATLASTDYSSFDAIVISSVPGSTSAGFIPLEAVNKPKLLLKPFTLRNTVWNWVTGTAVNTAQTTVTISDKTHPIFSGLTFTGLDDNELQLFSSVSTNAVTGITNSTWIATPAVTVLGNANTAPTTNSVVEIPVGTNMNGTVTTHRFIMLGISEFSMTSLTTTARQLIENSLYYILGLDVAIKVYTFTGNGNWDDAANWMNNEIPPAILSGGSQIIIDPVINGECILNVDQTINSGSSIIIKADKKFTVPGNLEIK
ncbi:right-handed parallel beta-helix repeat-containing protein [Ferruginibacter sp. SUN002]|uniref:right-handed parallel beta-helix repeat-containing protein n=1 Tax=Ferruginibacter sp. SUN002 TaxID=2937789 RepID=UPI003D36A076